MSTPLSFFSSQDQKPPGSPKLSLFITLRGVQSTVASSVYGIILRRCRPGLNCCGEQWPADSGGCPFSRPPPAGRHRGVTWPNQLVPLSCMQMSVVWDRLSCSDPSYVSNYAPYGLSRELASLPEFRLINPNGTRVNSLQSLG